MNTQFSENPLEASNQGSFPLAVLRFFNHLLCYKWLLFWGTGIPSVAIVVTMLLTRDYYQASAVMIPPSRSGGGSSLASMLGELGGMASLLNLDLGNQNDIDLTIEIAESDNFRRKIIEKFNLFEHYEFDPGEVKIESVIKTLNRKLTVVESDYGNLIISFEDKEPKICSTLVAYSFYLVDSMYLAINNKKLVTQQKFIEEKEKMTRASLSASLDTLIKFEQKHKMYMPEQQMEELVSILVELEKKKRILEDEMEFVRRTESGNSETYKKLGIKKQLLKRQLDSLDRGELAEEKILTSLKNTPSLIKQHQELFIEVKIQKELLKFFIQTNEELKFRASTDYEQLQMLSPGFMPTKKFGPPKGAICIVIFCIAFIFSILISLGHRYYVHQKGANTDLYSQWVEFIGRVKTLHKIKN